MSTSPVTDTSVESSVQDVVEMAISQLDTEIEQYPGLRPYVSFACIPAFLADIPYVTLNSDSGLDLESPSAKRILAKVAEIEDALRKHYCQLETRWTDVKVRYHGREGLTGNQLNLAVELHSIHQCSVDECIEELAGLLNNFIQKRPDSQPSIEFSYMPKSFLGEKPATKDLITAEILDVEKRLERMFCTGTLPWIDVQMSNIVIQGKGDGIIFHFTATLDSLQ